MLKVDQYEYIRVAHRVYSKSIKELARETGHSRNTIRRVVRGEYTGYSRRTTQWFPVLNPFMDIIDSWLEEDKKCPIKQRHTARRVYHRLVEEHGYRGSESTVRRYVRQAKARLGLNGNQAYIPLSPDIGQEAEVDWGTVLVKMRGKTRRLKLFCMRSKYSGKIFLRIYPVERQQALFDAHMHAFVFYGGVFKRLIYDNLTTAVKAVLKGKKRIEQDAYHRFRAYYTFEVRFCTPGEAHEKGGIEGLVGFSRRNFFVPLPETDTLEELNQYLIKRCLAYGQHVISGQTQSVDELFEKEKGYLIPLPQVPFENTQSIRSKVNHYSTVIVDRNRYSVPTSYAGLQVETLLYVDRVEVFYDGKRIATHSRLYGNNKWSLEPDHYLDLLYKRPGAFNQARPIKNWRARWPISHERLLKRFQDAQGETKGIKDFVSVLMLYRDFDAPDVEAAIEKAVQAGVSSSEAVKHFLISKDPFPDIVTLDTWPVLPQADVSVYSQLGGAL